MARKRFGLAILLPLAIMALAASGMADPILVNGSFENTNNTWVDNTGVGEMKISPPSTAIPGWTVISGELAWAPGGFGLTASDGLYMLDLTGFDDSNLFGGVTLGAPAVTIPGLHYTVSFDLGSSSVYNGPNYGPGYVGGPVSVQVDVGPSAGSNLDFTGIFVGNTPTQTNQWDPRSFEFIPSANTTFLQFTGLGADKTAYIGLDNVSLTENPEPGSILLLGSGLGLIGLAASRRKK